MKRLVVHQQFGLLGWFGGGNGWNLQVAAGRLRWMASKTTDARLTPDFRGCIRCEVAKKKAAVLEAPGAV